jgi:hypothetical protein
MFLIMFTLKLCGVIAFSWWLVTAPIWIPFAIFLAVPIMVCLLACTGIGICDIMIKIEEKKLRK